MSIADTNLFLNTNRKAYMRLRLNQEYRNKIANRMRVHIEAEDTQEKEKYTTNINYYTDSEKMDEEYEETEQLLELYDKSVHSTVDGDGNYVRM